MKKARHHPSPAQRTPQAGNVEQLSQRARSLSAAGSWADACVAWQQLIAIRSTDAQAWSNLALARAYAGQYPESIDAFSSAMQHGLAPDEVAAGMGLVFCLRQQYDVARENLEMAVASNPANIRAWANLVVTYVRLGLVQHAFQAAERVLAVEPENASVFSSLGTLCKDMGMADEAVAWCQRAAEASPHDPYAISNLLWAMLHADSVSTQDIVAQAHEFNRRACAKAPRPAVFSPTRENREQAPLRVGWLSGDLRKHAVGNFVIPVLEKLDRTLLSSTIYNTSHLIDEMSQRAKQAVDSWHEVARLSDTQLARRIAEDGIDILIDLAGHTDGSRLQVFAHRPARVQVTWLGYPGTTGVAAMDYILTPPDPILLKGNWCTEKPLALPDCYSTRDVAQLLAPDDAQAPSISQGFITFGCLNNFAKVSASSIAVWASILSQVEHAKLIMVATGGSDADLVADIRERFAAHDIDPTRIDVRGRMDADSYRATFREIDIGLDPFPFNGGATGFDSLCMGTPYVTLAGQSLHERMGANLLRVIGLDELIAGSMDEYVGIAVTLANQQERLRALHAGMRQRMLKSALMDTARFARGLEDLFRKIARPAN